MTDVLGPVAGDIAGIDTVPLSQGPDSSGLVDLSEPAEDQLARLWSDSLAPAWEHYRDRLFSDQRRASHWLVDQLNPQPGQTILELAAGPGETGFLVAERLGAKGKLVSTDFGPAMVDAARRGAERRGLANVEYRVMDAQQIDLPEDSVDGVLCRFGLMLMPDPLQALRGAQRTLRRGGRIAYAVWGSADNNPWITALAKAMIAAGSEPPEEPFGPGSPFGLATADSNRDLVEAAGFSDVQVEEIVDVMHFDDLEDYWALQSRVSGPLAIFLYSLPADARWAIRSALDPFLAPFATSSGFDIPSLVIGVAAA